MFYPFFTSLLILLLPPNRFVIPVTDLALFIIFIVFMTVILAMAQFVGSIITLDVIAIGYHIQDSLRKPKKEYFQKTPHGLSSPPLAFTECEVLSDNVDEQIAF